MGIRFIFYKTVHVTLLMGLLLILLGASVAAIIQWYFIPQLPSTESLRHVQLQVPLRVYTKDKVFITEYGEQRRIPLSRHQIPQGLIDAILAAEDDRFYEHQGVDLKSLFRASISLLKTGEKRQGGSTITMQVARNFFLSHKRTFTRKFNEILLALKIEEELSKDDILELYLNKIYFGHRAYGVGAAAQTYYGKNVDKLSLAEWAMLAGLPKAPSVNNPLTNPEPALERRNYVLKRMHILNFISQEEYETAIKAANTAKPYQLTQGLDALYLAEMVRSFLIKKFGEEVMTKGYRVFTTIDSRLQIWANAKVRKHLFSYDRVRGFRGVLDHVSIPKNVPSSVEKWTDDDKKWANDILQKYPNMDSLVPSIVLRVRYKSIEAYNKKAGKFKISWYGISWARKPRGRYPKSARSVLKRGDIIMAHPNIQYRSKKNKKKKREAEQKDLTENLYKAISQKDFKKVRWRLSQPPDIEAALVAIKPKNGAIISLVGGFDFYKSKFNRVTQAKRQPGSSFKPFIYSAALARGYSPSSAINDAPIAFRISGGKWRPKNYSHKYYGWTTLRKALRHSYNVSAVKLLSKVGIRYTINHLTKFGFKKEAIPKNLTISLGTYEVTPLELTMAFAIFANGGFQIKPYFIDHIEDVNGKIVYSANPWKICKKCSSEVFASKKELVSDILVKQTDCTRTPRYAPRAIRAGNAYTMNSMLRDVIRRGTGYRAQKLKRRDIAGKTGTTSNQHDVWFVGYSPDIVTTVWVGFDKPRSIGYKATGGNTALPIWINFMRAALAGKSVKSLADFYELEQKSRKERDVEKPRVKKPVKKNREKPIQKKRTVVVPEEQLF